MTKKQSHFVQKSITMLVVRPKCTALLCSGYAKRTSARYAITMASRQPGPLVTRTLSHITPRQNVCTKSMESVERILQSHHPQQNIHFLLFNMSLASRRYSTTSVLLVFAHFPCQWLLIGTKPHRGGVPALDAIPGRFSLSGRRQV